ncbi:substrate-binding domain-containing protein [Vibrio sp. S11_S32]|uniref:substrate-binding domain-containing protein n=1 Tax=Vibrio sp. S11_S32 TaxID=2720225 RepID=UPI00168093C0|nr:substrate-binding domain-containing protein [Vibrio sp. S11_S32]MBD1576478.1 substrate-binding domain-containing protein [Vibrio sp. S11_S32]
MATMKDVARIAQVSTSTVSHVFNQTRFVSEDIAKRVNNAAQELNYAPSALARSLKMKCTKTLGMLVTTSTNPFFGEVLKGVERRCYEKGYNLILCNTEGDSERMKASINTLLQKRVDGLMLMCSTLEGEEIEIFSRYPELPIVVMDWGPMAYASDKIQDNSYKGGYLATQYLIDRGHKEIGCVTGPLHRNQAISRFNGFKQALTDNHITINQDWIAEGNFECDGGFNAYQTFKRRSLAQGSSLPTALFACNDMMAMGLINAASQDGLHIPNDISVIGYDDIQLAKYITPSLTTIHQPKHQLGKTAVDTLLARLNEPKSPQQIVQLEPTLVARHSVKVI